MTGQVLMVANPGGHLQQLHLLDPRLPFAEERLWVTADTPQSRSLLADREAIYVQDVGSRQYGALARNLPSSLSLLRRHHLRAVVSTGSGLALAYLPFAAVRGISTHYIESATRTDGPSFTGKILQRVPRLDLYTQHRQWQDGNWQYGGSVFDGFEVAHHAREPVLRRVVVSLGTSRIYGFRRLVAKLVDLIPRDAEVLWQTGCTDVSGLDIGARDQVPSADLEAALAEADLVIAHAGTGIALSAFVAGCSPVLVPREFAHGEHVDDHQMQTARLLGAGGLAVVSTVDELTSEDLHHAAARRIEYRPAAAAQFALRA